MTGIWDFPRVDELVEFIEGGVESAVITSKNELDDEERVEFIDRLNLERVIVFDEWGNGTAEIGGDTLDMFLFFSVEGEDEPTLLPRFDNASRFVTQTFVVLINEGFISPPEPAREWFPNFEPNPVGMDRLADQVNRVIGRREGNSVADLTTRNVIRFVDPVEIEGQDPDKPVAFRNLPRTPFEEMVEEEEEEPEEEEIDEEELGPELGPETPPEEEEIELSVEEVVEQASRDFEISPGVLEIPAGKPTRRVEYRDLYEFELKMALPAEPLSEMGIMVAERYTDGIGFAIELGRVGTSQPAANYPKTSSYVKHYLNNIGPQYILKLYKDLVFYSGFISSFHGMRLKPGRYSSFRQFMYRLEQIGERGGPELVKGLSQQQAAARGLETLPDHPTIEDEKAPWLEKRHYYRIIEDNVDHEAWDNPTEFLYEELGPIEQ